MITHWFYQVPRTLFYIWKQSVFVSKKDWFQKDFQHVPLALSRSTNRSTVGRVDLLIGRPSGRPKHTKVNLCTSVDRAVNWL